jgi:acetate kinase
LILVLNAGSSSLKLAVYAVSQGELQPQLQGSIQDLPATPHLRLQTVDGAVVASQDLPADNYVEPVLAATLAQLAAERFTAAGHRVVHGGLRHAGPARVTPDLLLELSALTPLAPLHQEADLAPIRTLARLEPGLPQVVSFDTAFHLGMPDTAARFAIPAALHDAGLRRYGAHGLSYSYIADRLRSLDPALAAGRVVVAHLGSGASLCALQNGRSVDTTMGLTPLDGLVMATRCGALDPGLVLYLQAERGMSVQAVQDMLYHQSGLLGVSGRSGDMRVLLQANDPASQQAVALFNARLAKEIAAMAASLGGIDGLVFCGGIGEHVAPVRQAAAAQLRFLGIEIDPAANHAARQRIDAAGSRVAVFVLPTDEELVIAREVRQVLAF